MTSRPARSYRTLLAAAAALSGIPVAAGCTPTEPARSGQACAALVQVLADGRQVPTQLQALAGASATPGAPVRQLLAGGLQEDVESAREMLAALPAAVAPTQSPTARDGAAALLAGDAAGAAVRTSPVPVALTALARMRAAAGAARDQLRCG